MTAERKTELDALRMEIQQRTGKTPEALYEEREKRVREAIELKEPDRVPISLNADPSTHAGIRRSAAYYDPAAWKKATRQIHLDFEPDMANAGFANSGPAWEALEMRNGGAVQVST